ncbi:hypothetical protein [Burkholderia glumae]|uniref:Lipoprotein n=1 Tax=Burkholderia glumae TaxID=337 RepID=A0AAQ0BQ10_BURGL|nr:hypothetical protein [Burkholderia glumae]ACR32014.1 Hypothetical protein bglu_2g16740 [Burkholderia glumae BGR1]AJY64605.1 hypothetical protein KS03_4260 [Burkholderia glumae LMG 2196 = ATCC 33617]KHJ60472.1 hypothetical protein NCPPB3923_23865 [Burkholderia glumae]MCM2495191.1 hypothetical protein [Burkholderia glumae]MCM2540269.1 hypothetical protein [Burkholderia glumae]
MKRWCLAAFAATAFSTGAPAQSSAPGPLAAPCGTLQFERGEHDVVASCGGVAFDRFGADALVHFDEPDAAGNAVVRLLVQTDAGPALYDLRRRPPLVQRAGRRLAVRRVFWQGDAVVMQGPQGWFRLRNGTLTQLQSSTTVYH